MPIRDRCAVLVTPIFIRLLLGVVFMWAGLGKVLDDHRVSSADAAALANMGVAVTPASSAPAPAGDTAQSAGPTPLAAPVQAGSKVFTPEDFPEGANVLNVYGVALTVMHATLPGTTSDGKQKMALWPETLGRAAGPVYTAWAVAMTEIIGGFFVLLGLVTRISAFALAVISAGALWLTQIGPAVQSGHARLGFLPSYPAFSAADWHPFFLLFALLMAALTLALAGPGYAGLDRAVFRRRAEPGDDGDDAH